MAGITLHDLLFYFEQEQEASAEDEDSVSHVGLLAAAQLEDAEAEGDVARMREDDAKDDAKDDVVDDVARMREDDAVFKATMFQLLRRQSVDRVDLQHVADTRSKYFFG